MTKTKEKELIKEAYENANWIFRELITLEEFRKVINHISESNREIK